jgi:hypothetical protein
MSLALPAQSRARSVDFLRRHRPRRDRRTREQINRDSIARLKADIEPSRITLAIGCHIIGTFDAATPLDQVVDHVVRWADDPLLPAPVPHAGEWWWSRGEQVAVWLDSRILAVVALGFDGRPAVKYRAT